MNSALKNMVFMLCVCGLHSAATAQVVAVDFGGDYRFFRAGDPPHEAVRETGSEKRGI